MDEFERGRRAGIEASAACLEGKAASCVSPFDLAYGGELRLHAEYVRSLVESPSTVLVGERKDLERACERLKAIGPPADCIFCEDQPCASCMERARISGELHSTLALLNTWLVEAK